MSVAAQLHLALHRGAAAVIRDYVALTKPRVILLLEVTTLFAMIVARHGWPGTELVVATLAGGWLAASGANAINQWYDRDIDAAMLRTRGRPVPGGRIEPHSALVFGVALALGAFVVLFLFANLLAAVLAEIALLFYVLVYTMWLKRTSAQNIVIGGAAGALPPAVGWAAATGGLDLTALYLVSIIFFWTPPHFWALALLMRDDYQRADVPMLPVVAGGHRTRQQIWLFTVVLTVVTALPFVAGLFGLVYLAGAAALDGAFLAGSFALLLRPSAAATRRLFHYSLLYLAALFAVMAADRMVAG
ncbi:MAG: heme o synthase [Candidatus Dormibacteria bacterium]